MKVFLVEGMYLFGKVGPGQRPSKFLLELPRIALCRFFGEFDLPPTEVVEQPHVGLDKNG